MAVSGMETDGDLSPSWGIVAAYWSKTLGFADTLASYGMQLKPFPSHRLFTDGWGDLTLVDACREHTNALVADYSGGRLPDINVEFGKERSMSGGAVKEGRFESPMASFLPAEARDCVFEMLVPQGPVRAVVVHFPGTGDQSYAFRRHALAAPLFSAGVASLLPMPAFYGSRRPQSQRLHYISTVADFCLQSGALIAEGLWLLDWAERQFPGALLCVTGLSWGGAMASCVGSVALRQNVAIVPILPSGSPAVLVTGALRCEIAMGSLAKGGCEVEAEHALLELLTAINVSDLMANAAATSKEASGAKVVLQVSAAHDAFVQPSDALSLFEQLLPLDASGECAWVPGGHVSSFATARALFPGRVLTALQRLAAKVGRPACFVESPSKL